MNSRIFCLAAIILIAGCSRPSLSGDVYSRDQARIVHKVHHGEVLEVREVGIEGDYSVLGTFGGYKVGKEIGRTVGSGSGRKVAGATVAEL